MTNRQTSPESTDNSSEPTGKFPDSLRVGLAVCAEIRDAVVSILREEESNPAWSDSDERYAIMYEQEEELAKLLKTHVTLRSFNSNELPHEVKLALAELQTHQDRPKGALYRLLAETIEVAGPAVM